MIQCKQKTNSYLFKYPKVAEFADEQHDIFWTWKEIDVEKDLQDMKTNFTESEYHGTITTLKLFTLYELIAGSEYWGGRFKKIFPRPEFQRMASCFSNIELNVHAPFYNRLNEVLGINTEEFYTNYVEDPILQARMNFIDSAVSDKDDLFSLAVFSMVEGVILFSSFAFLKHFQAEGKNKLVNVTAGINFSLRDELLHSKAGAWVFRILYNESNLTDQEKEALNNRILEAGSIILEHEKRIIDMVFEKGSIKGITPTQMEHFVESRIDSCLEYLGINKVYKPKYNPIADWFYKNITTSQFHDFFHKIGSEYNRDWNERKFIW